MSLSRRIAAEVDDLVKSGAPPRHIIAEEGPHRIDLPVSLATPVGIECDGLEFLLADCAGTPLDDLKAWGSRLAARLSYLMEPLSVLEADPVGGEVVLRSQAPTPRNGRRSYYEVRLRDTGRLTLDRFSFDETTRQRRKTPCQFTAEVLERLIDDLVATA